MQSYYSPANLAIYVVIKPKRGLAELCRKWRRLPKERDYLAVCVSMLEIFYAKSGHRQDH